MMVKAIMKAKANLPSVVNAKKILSVSGKHVIYIDQYGNVREALLK